MIISIFYCFLYYFTLVSPILMLNNTKNLAPSICLVLLLDLSAKDKPNAVHIVAQGRLRSISTSSLCAQSVAKDLRFLHAETEGTDQAGRVPTKTQSLLIAFVRQRLFNKYIE